MKRRLVKQGPNTMTVSLPRKWVERLELREGDEIDVKEEGTGVLVNAEKGGYEREIKEIDFSEIPENLVKVTVLMLYKRGLKDMRFLNLDQKKTELVEELLNSLIGFEIMEKSSKGLYVTDLSAFDEGNLEKAKMQIYWRLLNMLENVKERDLKPEKIHKQDLEINKLSFYIQRNIQLAHPYKKENFLIYEEVNELESFGDAIQLFWEQKQKKGYSNFIDKIHELLKSIRTLENKKDLKFCSEIKKKKKELKKEINKKENTHKIILVSLGLMAERLESLLELKISKHF